MYAQRNFLQGLGLTLPAATTAKVFSVCSSPRTIGLVLHLHHHIVIQLLLQFLSRV
jgi:hypothetical protein